MKQQTAYHAGLAAENSVAIKYRHSGFSICAERFKTKSGEIDIVAQHEDKFYFIEVKKSKTIDCAAQMIRPRQIQRIKDAALLFLQKHALPLETEMRFDAALVDSVGHIKVIPNAFS